MQRVHCVRVTLLCSMLFHARRATRLRLGNIFTDGVICGGTCKLADRRVGGQATTL